MDDFTLVKHYLCSQSGSAAQVVLSLVDLLTGAATKHASLTVLPLNHLDEHAVLEFVKPWVLDDGYRREVVRVLVEVNHEVGGAVEEDEGQAG